MAHSLAEIEAEVLRLAGGIDAPSRLLPTFGTSRDGGHPHIEVGGIHGLQLSWVVRERGEEWERRTTLDLDELLYWTFEAVTFSMASDWEVKHRVDGQDSRRLLFSHQLELLDRLDSAWGERRKRELGPLLREVGL